MNILDAAYEVMKSVKKPMSPKEIVKVILDTGAWTTTGKTPWEKTCGKHPTQKPLGLVVRALLACTDKHARVLDPFAGSSTTGIAANLIGRSFVGIEQELEYLKMSKLRREAFEAHKDEWAMKIPDLVAVGSDPIGTCI